MFPIGDLQGWNFAGEGMGRNVISAGVKRKKEDSS
jgi:hypothetical protein